MSPGIPLTVMFARPAIVLEGSPIVVRATRLVVGVNGYPIYDGAFHAGFERTVDVFPGRHFVDTRIEVGPILRTRRYPIDVAPARGYTVALSYSRLWGNFTRKPLVTPY